MVQDILTPVGNAIEGVTDSVGNALMPNATDAQKTAAGVALAALVGFGIAFAFRKKLMKPVTRYRVRRATRRASKR